MERGDMAWPVGSIARRRSRPGADPALPPEKTHGDIIWLAGTDLRHSGIRAAKRGAAVSLQLNEAICSIGRVQANGAAQQQGT